MWCSVERKLELGDKAGNKSFALLFAFIFKFYSSEVQMAHLPSVLGGAYVTPNYQVDTTIPKLKIDRRHSPAHRLFFDQQKVFSWI